MRSTILRKLAVGILSAAAIFGITQTKTSENPSVVISSTASYSAIVSAKSEQTEPELAELKPDVSETEESIPVETETNDPMTSGEKPKNVQQAATDSKVDPIQSEYVVNVSSKKFHKPECSSVAQMKPENRLDFFGSEAELIMQGYDPCKRCIP